MMVRRFRAVQSAVLLAAAAMGFGEVYQRINVQSARELAYLAVKDHNLGVTLTEAPRPLDPDFYYFGATWPNPSGSPVIGYFAVNPWTGDVWDANGCTRYTSKELNVAQKAIRKRSRIEGQDYSRLRARRPLCIEHNARGDRRN